VSDKQASEILIEPKMRIAHFWRDLLTYRDLFFFLAWRDIKVRYKQTVIGILWSILQPLATMVIMVVVFGKIAKLPSQNIPYPVLVFSAMLPWYFFSSSFSAASNSLVGNAGLLTKIYFPRIILPASSMIVSLVDFCISFVILVAIMLYYGIMPGLQVVLLPVLVLLALITSLGASLWVGTLNVKYRDFRYVIPFLVQLGLYVSPVGFSSDVVPEKFRLLYSLNPMVGVIDGFRWALLGTATKLFVPGLLLSIGIAILFLISGFIYFRNMEKEFADVI
jgi:lipopolysaccharide transport system permease protein